MLDLLVATSLAMRTPNNWLPRIYSLCPLRGEGYFWRIHFVLFLLCRSSFVIAAHHNYHRDNPPCISFIKYVSVCVHSIRSWRVFFLEQYNSHTDFIVVRVCSLAWPAPIGTFLLFVLESRIHGVRCIGHFHSTSLDRISVNLKFPKMRVQSAGYNSDIAIYVSKPITSLSHKLVAKWIHQNRRTA
jgi:hypothetical protein